MLPATGEARLPTRRKAEECWRSGDVIVTAVASERSYLRRPRLCRMPAMAGELWQHASEDSERACQRRHESGRAGESGSASRPEALGKRHARATE